MKASGRFLAAGMAALLLLTAPAWAEDKSGEKNDPRVAEICDLIAANAEAVGMAPDFFARLIWKESRFDEGARSPVGAEGIAQFMPYTARERGLSNPYDKAEALKHSALYLRDLRAELGSWGLAAAAYNGGINRVKRWRQTSGRLPYETEDYVLSITAQPASFFREEAREAAVRPLVEGLDFALACRRLPVLSTRAVFAMAESAPMRPWGAQIAGNPNEAIAVNIFQKLKDRYPGLLGDVKPIVMRVRPLSGPRRITAIRVGADSRKEANGFCAKYRGAGGACVVLRN